jgi:hypothetical protein
MVAYVPVCIPTQESGNEGRTTKCVLDKWDTPVLNLLKEYFIIAMTNQQIKSLSVNNNIYRKLLINEFLASIYHSHPQ